MLFDVIYIRYCIYSKIAVNLVGLAGVLWKVYNVDELIWRPPWNMQLHLS